MAGHEDSLSIEAPDSPISSAGSLTYSLAEMDLLEHDLSEDEGLPPNQPAFTGLFPQALFKSLLFKAINTAHLGSTLSTPPLPPSSQEALDPLFVEPPRAVDSIPTPQLFLDVIKKQWTLPGSASAPTATEHKNFNMAPDVASLLQTPTVGAPVVALLPNADIPGDPDEGLGPDEWRSDQVLQWAFQGAVWAIRSASTASFFNKMTLLWLRQLQENLVTEDIRVRQDLNKIITAVQFSADATLNAGQFTAKSLASSVMARRLVWLRHWQADARHKWCLASVPFMGSRLFGDPLDSFLIETKDKQRVLPATYCRGESRFQPYPSRPSFRGYDGGSSSFSATRSHRSFQPRQRGAQDRASRGRPFVNKQPFRGGGGHSF